MPLLIGSSVILLAVLSLMNISGSREVVVQKNARDFLVIVDTSRSMRENTSLLRRDFPPKYERRAGRYADDVAEPGRIPELARYEVARESLLDFLASRGHEDRIALIYFNTEVYLMSGFTTDIDFIEQQFAQMDDYVTYSTNIRWALEQGLDMIERYPARNRQTVILLTDAEANYTTALQQQMDRIAKLDLAFYVLWIRTDENGEASDAALRFLRSARLIGSVYTVDEMGQGYLDEALAEIAELESYSYAERRFETFEFSEGLLAAAQWLTLLWIVLTATVHYPVSSQNLGRRR